MSDATDPTNWTDKQWSDIRALVADEAQKTRVAAEFLPLYGPVDPSVVAVPDLLLGYAPIPPPPAAAPAGAAPLRIQVASAPGTFLATLSVQVALSNHEVADPELLAARAAFRRAAVIIARIEDALVFTGQPGPGLAPPPLFPGGWLATLPGIYQVTGGFQQAGLVPTGAGPRAVPPAANVPPRAAEPITPPVALPAAGPAPLAAIQAWGPRIVAGVVGAVGQLEANGHSGPFACFLSPLVFQAVHTPATGSSVLPREQILPFLGGDNLRRSNTIPDGYGIIVALGGGPIEIVVGSEIGVQFLQTTLEPRHLFRVKERIAFRVKEWDAVAVLHP
jgi:uncharacterized linocin/CFP29 family protein